MAAGDFGDVEYFVAANLDNEGRVFTWDPQSFFEPQQPEANPPQQRPRHTLCLKKAIVGMTAKEGELNLIELSTKGKDDEEIRVPLAYLQTGTMYQTSLDLSLSEKVVRLSLIKGTGPVHVLGQHVITTPVADEEVGDEEVGQLIAEAGGEVNGGEEEEAEVIDQPASPKLNVTASVPPAPKEEGNDKKRKSEADASGSLKKVKLGLGAGTSASVAGASGSGSTSTSAPPPPPAAEEKEKPENGNSNGNANGNGTSNGVHDEDDDNDIDIDEPTESK